MRNRSDLVASLIKWVFAALAVFAVYTAEPEQKEAMWNGAKAFGAAMVTACTREASPCTTAIAWTREQINPSPEKIAAPSGTLEHRRLEPLAPPPAVRTDEPTYGREPIRSW
jgi:hypothetical protein